MSKNTYFHTRFWQDSYVCDLDPSEKLIFIYALTSPYLGLTGIYEVPLKYIAVETGIEKDMVAKILKRFQEDKKIIYHEGWLCVVKYPRYQSFKGEPLLKAVNKEISAIPKDILDYFIGYGYPIDTLSIGYMVMERVMDMEVVMEKNIQKAKKETKKIIRNDKNFDSFWSAYPVKKGKGNAEKSWEKLKPDLQAVLTAIEAQKKTDQWTKDKGKFIPYPATWLNGKRWEDEVEVVTSSKFAKYDS
jgi:hypothetical protein